MPAGSSRVERLDPFSLPLRFEQPDHAADERVRVVELHRERVILRRALRGIKMAVNLPLAAYRGVAIRIEEATLEWPAGFAIVLEHIDPALSLTLYRAEDGNNMVAEWRSWARVRGMPLLVPQSGSGLREPFERMGSVPLGRSSARRARHGVGGGGASKAALEASCVTWAKDLEGTGVTVNVLVPGGPTDTPGFFPPAMQRPPVLLDPEIMAASVSRMCWRAFAVTAGASARRGAAAMYAASARVAGLVSRNGSITEFPRLWRRDLGPASRGSQASALQHSRRGTVKKL